MPATDPRRVKDLFVAALEIADPGDRAALIERECREDSELRRRVEALLAAHDQPASVLERPLAVGPDTWTYEPKHPPEADPDTGRVIAGRFKLLEPIGEGGMGRVWVADQLAPIRRRVALKLIKPGMDSRTVLARFEAERQALALMDHPNIAKVLDAGTADDGRPFFVMELVKGVSITQFCDARRLNPRERLELFVPVCQAIQHAHQKGIIHRDIKPSNVLVALHDESPVPKVIDFGVAKAVGQQLTEKTLYTGFGALVGTPAYMAPEQATLNQLDVDTRTDVYALGVLLYELLAGTPPFEPERLRQKAIDEVLKLVREEEPPRPSARLSTSQQRASLAAVRRSDPEALSRLIRGELDWIVMKALEKDRNRRYDTASNLAADVRRHLEGEPVQAHPPGAPYRFGKFARKHRAGLMTAGAFVALLVMASLFSSMQAIRARREEEAARDSARLAMLNLEKAKRLEGELWESVEKRTEALAESRALASSLQIDLDLAELKADPRRGLLRLAKRLRESPEIARHETISTDGGRTTMYTDLDSTTKQKELREFVTLAVLAAGQDFAPLLPPIAHEESEIDHDSTLSPDNTTLLTVGGDGTARLWDVRTARQVATLRKGNERVDRAHFSPDGRTVVTLDERRIARFWDAPTGVLRVESEQPLHVDPEKMAGIAGFPDAQGRHANAEVWLTDRRLMTVPVHWKQISRTSSKRFLLGLHELWDIETGRRIAQFDWAEDKPPYDKRIGNGRWVAWPEDPANIRVYSLDDGHLVARLSHPGAVELKSIFTDPEARKFTTLVKEATGHRFRVFDPAKAWAETANWPVKDEYVGDYEASWWGDDTIVCRFWAEPLASVHRAEKPEVFPLFKSSRVELLPPRGDLAQVGAGEIYDRMTMRRLVPPPGRKFHPSLARFARDGRFVVSGVESDDTLIDVHTDKTLSYQVNKNIYALPGFGCFVLDRYSGETEQRILLLPGPGRLDLSADLLELWAQVAVCGELGPEGEFVPWDEPAWQRRRQELASRPMPRADFPFPGPVANDALHWLRAEYEQAPDDADRLRLASELLRRSEGLGDRAEAARWRKTLEGLKPKPAPAEEAK